MCVNVPDVNRRTIPPVHPMPNTQDIVDEVGVSKYLSALDAKAGFQNVVMDPDSKQYCEVVTQDGVWVLERMTYGFMGAPYAFQAIMEEATQESKCKVYVDDVHPHDDDLQ